MSSSNRIADDFSNAASNYDEFAQLQRDVVDSILHWVPDFDGISVLDAGSGTGYAMRSGWTALDIAEGMCKMVLPSVCADMQSLPFADAKFNAIFSSLAMQWLSDIDSFLQESNRCVEDNGCLVLSTLGQGTLIELRDSFSKSGMFVPLLPFHSEEELKSKLKKSGWNIVEYEVDYMSLKHENVQDLLRHLKGLGARYKRATESSGLNGKEWLNKLQNNYRNKLNHNIISSWEVIKIKAEKIL